MFCYYYHFFNRVNVHNFDHYKHPNGNTYFESTHLLSHSLYLTRARTVMRELSLTFYRAKLSEENSKSRNNSVQNKKNSTAVFKHNNNNNTNNANCCAYYNYYYYGDDDDCD